MDVGDKHDAAVKTASAQSAEAVRWASMLRALEAGMADALVEAVGENVANPRVSLIATVDALLEEG